ncbi:MAG: hypothetical protein AAF743_17075, partial [Planctomycetota bacterium]
ELPPEALVYTNVPDVLFLLQGRSAKPMPRLVDPTSGERVPRYRERLRAFRRDLQDNAGFVVFFDPIPRVYWMDEQRFNADNDTRLIVELDDGAVYQVAPPQR